MTIIAQHFVIISYTVFEIKYHYNTIIHQKLMMSQKIIEAFTYFKADTCVFFGKEKSGNHVVYEISILNCSKDCDKNKANLIEKCLY